MRNSLRAVSLALAPMLVAGCPRGLVGGSASGSASVQVGATVSIRDPPASTATPIDERGQAEVKLAACARGDVAAQVAIVSDFVDSCHEMIVCGGLTNQFGVAIVSVLLSAALGKDLSIGAITYQGDGVYKVGDVMTMTLVLGRDTSWGKVGDVTPFDVTRLDSYFTEATVTASASVSIGPGGRETKQQLTVSFAGVGPGVELLGLGPNPASGVKVDFHEVARSLGGAIQTANVITVDDRKGESHIGYHLTSAPQRFGELLGHAPQGMTLVSVDATRGAQRVEVTSWGMQFQPGSSGTLDGTIDLTVHGDFDYRVHLGYPHRKEPDVTLACP